jgi:hypothetical protein
MSLREARDFTVIDSRGRTVGAVAAPMYGSRPDVPDAADVRAGIRGRKHFIVPNTAVHSVDRAAHLVRLRVPRRKLVRFL